MIESLLTNIRIKHRAKINNCIFSIVKALRIAYISESSPSDKHAWSGTVHYVYQALQKKGFHLQALGPAQPAAERYLLGALNKMSLNFFGKRIDYRHSHLYSKAFARIFRKKIRTQDYDLIIHCGTTETGAYLDAAVPVVYILDRTIAGALNYHTILSNLWKFSENQSVAVDKKAMEKAALLVFSSSWAAEHAIRLYGIAPSKVAIIPFGANLDTLPSRAEVLLPKPTDCIRLFLMGTYWENKGADIAYNALQELRKAGFKVKLTVAGCQAPPGIEDPDLEIIPFIDKNSESGLTMIKTLFLSHHFFILPTRFDCTPIVFCEASAFGVPILSADTGGVRGHLKSGVNGYVIPYEDRGAAYAEKVKEIMRTPGRYEALCQSTRAYYEEQLNWERWADEFSKALQDLT
jgi:glycosyltransferase involved in cell wall biosynthesis